MRPIRCEEELVIIYKIIATVLVVLGLAGLLLGRLGETVWAPDTERTATVDLSDPGPAVVIDPGVLYVGGTEGEVKVAGSSDLSVITAPNADIDAYLKGTEHTRITGLSDWQTLTTKTEDADGRTSISNPTSSDLWRSVKTSASPVTIDIADFHAEESEPDPQPYREILLVTDGKQAGADSVSITWPVDAKNEWVPYAYAGGATLLIIGLVMLVVSFSTSRRSRVGGGDGEPDEPDEHGAVDGGSRAAVTAAAAPAVPASTDTPDPAETESETEAEADADPAVADAPAASSEPATEKLASQQDEEPAEDERPAVDEQPAEDERPTEDEPPTADEQPTEHEAASDQPAGTGPIAVGPGAGRNASHEDASGSEDPTEVIDRVEDPIAPAGGGQHRHRASTPDPASEDATEQQDPRDGDHTQEDQR